jgi:hypothetical protein
MSYLYSFLAHKKIEVGSVQIVRFYCKDAINWFIFTTGSTLL